MMTKVGDAKKLRSHRLFVVVVFWIVCIDRQKGTKFFFHIS